MADHPGPGGFNQLPRDRDSLNASDHPSKGWRIVQIKGFSCDAEPENHAPEGLGSK